jgi:hypothetical protein
MFDTADRIIVKRNQRNGKTYRAVYGLDESDPCADEISQALRDSGFSDSGLRTSVNEGADVQIWITLPRNASITQ